MYFVRCALYFFVFLCLVILTFVSFALKIVTLDTPVYTNSC